MAGLSDFTHLLTRYYLIGFIVPCYAWLVGLDLAVTEAWKPDYFDELGIRQFAALAVVATVLSLLLVPWRHFLIAAAAGGLDEEKGRPWLPFGRAIDKERQDVKRLWGESYSTLWPLARSLTSDREESYLDEADAEETLFIVGAFLAIPGSIYLLGNLWFSRHVPWYAALCCLLAAAVLIGTLYRQACSAIRRGATQSKATIALHWPDISDALKRMRK